MYLQPCYFYILLCFTNDAFSTVNARSTSYQALYSRSRDLEAASFLVDVLQGIPEGIKKDKAKADRDAFFAKGPQKPTQYCVVIQEEAELRQTNPCTWDPNKSPEEVAQSQTNMLLYDYNYENYKGGKPFITADDPSIKDKIIRVKNQILTQLGATPKQKEEKAKAEAEAKKKAAAEQAEADRRRVKEIKETKDRETKERVDRDNKRKAKAKSPENRLRMDKEYAWDKAHGFPELTGTKEEAAKAREERQRLFFTKEDWEVKKAYDEKQGFAEMANRRKWASLANIQKPDNITKAKKERKGKRGLLVGRRGVLRPRYTQWRAGV